MARQTVTTVAAAALSFAVLTPAHNADAQTFCNPTPHTMASTSELLLVGSNAAGQVVLCEGDFSPNLSTSTTITTCNTSTSAGVYLAIVGNGLNNQIHVHTGSSYLCGSTWMLPFSSSFAFGMHVETRGGFDGILGTDNGDILYTNDATLADDSANDQVCGHGGADILYGDADNSSPASEVLDGGSGSDTCFGVNAGGTLYDAAFSCESTPWSDLSLLPSAACSATVTTYDIPAMLGLRCGDGSCYHPHEDPYSCSADC